LKVIDLRFKEPGCTGHPVVRLNNRLRELNEDRVLIRFNLEDIPLKALELLIGRYGYRVDEVRNVNDYVEVVAIKA